MWEHGASWRRNRSDRLASETERLQLDNAVRFARLAKCGRRRVVNGDACRSLSIETVVVGVPVKYRLDAGPIDRFSRGIAHWTKAIAKEENARRI
jgi:hypothetical protein